MFVYIWLLLLPKSTQVTKISQDYSSSILSFLGRIIQYLLQPAFIPLSSISADSHTDWYKTCFWTPTLGENAIFFTTWVLWLPTCLGKERVTSLEVLPGRPGSLAPLGDFLWFSLFLIQNLSLLNSVLILNKLPLKPWHFKK